MALDINIVVLALFLLLSTVLPADEGSHALDVVEVERVLGTEQFSLRVKYMGVNNS
jgi:hypothetical protein